MKEATYFYSPNVLFNMKKISKSNNEDNPAKQLTVIHDSDVILTLMSRIYIQQVFTRIYYQ